MKQIRFINGGWGQEGGRPGEKRREAGEEEMGSGKATTTERDRKQE